MPGLKHRSRSEVISSILESTNGTPRSNLRHTKVGIEEDCDVSQIGQEDKVTLSRVKRQKA
jgi:hypothetical protein